MIKTLFHVFLSLLAAVLTCAAQTATIIPQDDVALLPFTGGRHIRNVQVLAVIVCPDDQPPLTGGPAVTLAATGGSIYNAAVARGFVPLPPVIAIAQINYALSHSRAYYAFEAVRIASIAAAVIGTRTLNPTQLMVLTGVHQLGDELAQRAQARLGLAPSLLDTLLDPEAKLDLSAGCRSATILAQSKAQAAKNARKLAKGERGKRKP